MSSVIEIRLATTSDAQGILDIYRPYILGTNTTFELEVPTIDDFSNRMYKYLEWAPWLVAVSDDQVLGYAYASKHRERDAYQWSIEVSAYVHDDFHGFKIGSRLYSCLFELLKEQGFCTLLAGIVQPNLASNAFHKSMGFEVVGTYPNIGYKFGQWSAVTWLSLSLLENQCQTPAPLKTMDQMIGSGTLDMLLSKHN